MELRQLRYFLTVAHEGTYGRASQKLHVAQPALSRQIKKLEQELGVELFVRHAHGVSLTPVAKGIRERAQHILDEVTTVTRLTRAHAETPTGYVRIGVSPGTAEILTYPLSQMLARRYPGVRCEIVSTLMPGGADQLRQDKVAFAVMNASRAVEGLKLVPLMREPLCLIYRADDPRFQGAQRLRIEDLHDVPLVVGRAPESGTRSIVDEAFAAAGMQVRIAAEVNTAGASKALVSEGVGVTVHVAAMACAELRRGELVAVPIENLYSTRVFAVSSERSVAPSTTRIMEVVRDCVTELVASGRWIGAEMIEALGVRSRNEPVRVELED